MKHKASNGHILLIVPKFFGYELEIKRALESRGNSVDWLRDRPYDKPWQLALLRLFPRLMLWWVNFYYQRALAKLPLASYDLILAVDPISLPCAPLRTLRKANPQARYVLYMWDSIENRKHVEDILPFFDAKWSFDPDSAAQFGMRFRPLFFLDGYNRDQQTPADYDISFIGSVHADRYRVISRLGSSLGPNVRRYFYLYLRAIWQFWAFKLMGSGMRRARQSEFQFAPIPKAQVIDVFNRSAAILDIEHPNQTGLTMRTFEALGAGKKLVTTNHRIREYDFYHPDNIAIIDREKPSVPESFWHSPYHRLDDALYRKYSIHGWLDEILEAEMP